MQKLADVALWFRQKDRKQHTANLDATTPLSSMCQAASALTRVLETCKDTELFNFSAG